MQIVILGSDLTFITKAGNGETEIVMTVTSYEQDFAEGEVFLVEQRNVVPLGRRLPEPIDGLLQCAASAGGATPKVMVTQGNDDRPMREHSPKLTQSRLSLRRHGDIPSNQESIGRNFPHPLREFGEHDRTPYSDKVKIGSNEQFHGRE